LIHGGVANQARVELVYVDAEELEAAENPAALLDVDAILVPGGFGKRGIEGKIRAVGHARRCGVPYLGICLGMQIAVIEFARNVCGLDRAHSTEFDAETPHAVVDLMASQREITEKGATMRLGAWPCDLAANSLAARVYGQTGVSERHRHRFEVANDYRPALEAKGMRFSGTSPDGQLAEMCEIPGHPWFLACQFHPEYKSRPLEPHPLFVGFVAAALRHAEIRRAGGSDGGGSGGGRRSSSSRTQAVQGPPLPL
jgi:CTP synthase